MEKKLKLIDIAGYTFFAAVLILSAGRYFGIFGGRHGLVANTVQNAVKAAKRPTEVKRLQKEYDAYVLPPESLKWFEQGDATGTIPVLVYHGIPNKASDWPDVSVKNFKEQMFALKKAGYHTVSMDDLNAFLHGNLKLDSRSILLTFDDGIRTSYENTDAILQAMDFHAAIFVISGYSLEDSNRYYLLTDDLKDMMKTGRWDIQSHSYRSHHREGVNEEADVAPPLANKLWLAALARLETDAEYDLRIRADLTKAKQQLNDFTGKDIYAFAVPFNDFGQLGSNNNAATPTLLSAVFDSYDLLFYQDFGQLGSNYAAATPRALAAAFETYGNQPQEIRPTIQGGDYRSNFPDQASDNGKHAILRISVDKEMTVASLMARLAASELKPLPYAEKFQNKYDWVDAYGTHLLSKGTLQLAPALGGTSYFEYLDGSYDWTDYRYDVEANWVAGQSFSLISRLRNAYDNVSCDFETNNVKLHRTKSDKQEDSIVLAVKALHAGPGLGAKKYGMSVEKGVLTCFYDGTAVISAALPDDVQFHGGVAVKSWDPTPEQSYVSLRSVDVRSLAPTVASAMPVSVPFPLPAPLP
jgi:peptidoglycan/xylan/chitin deacetylase (PgdA/CDA1 family)